VAARIVLTGDLQGRYEAERLLAESHPELHVDSVATSHDLVERALEGGYDVALLLKGSISQHNDRVHAVKMLRHGGYRGVVLFAGAFLSEREDATGAGADLVFDPDVRRVEEVVASALYLPTVAVDHPWLSFLLMDERAVVEPYRDELPEGTDLVLVTTSCHPAPELYRALPQWSRAHPTTYCVLIEDGGDDEARVEALAAGLEHHVVLENVGLKALVSTVRYLLRAAWLRRQLG
jgi:hypothetical protein